MSARISGECDGVTTYLSRMHSCMPQNDRFLVLLLSMLATPTPTMTLSFPITLRTLLFIAKQVKCIHGSILITFPNLELLRVVRESTDKIIPVIEVIGIVVI
jgi:hypothetical protein